MKTCIKCQKEKPLTDFAKNKRNTSGTSNTCKACHSLYCQARYEADKERIQAANREYYHAGKEREQQRSRRYYSANKASSSARSLTWQKNNRTLCNVYKQNRRGRLVGTYTVKEWIEVKLSQAYKCLACGKRKPLTADHVVPISKGGVNTIDNIQGLCKECNCAKGANEIDFRSAKNY